MAWNGTCSIKRFSPEPPQEHSSHASALNSSAHVAACAPVVCRPELSRERTVGSRRTWDEFFKSSDRRMFTRVEAQGKQ